MAVMLETTIGMVVPMESGVRKLTSMRDETDDKLGTRKTSL
jgi:hypothetical protein